MPEAHDVEIYDTTLRDGSQGEGISYSVQDKIRIARKLDELGIQYIEGGWPGSNPKDMAFFKSVRTLKFHATEVVAFGSTRRAGVTPSRDRNLKELVRAGTRTVTIFGKSWDLHVREALRTTLDENLKMIEDSIKFLRKRGLEVIYDAEHFFDGFKANPDYALKTLQVAESQGAKTLVLCDTNGGSLPSEVGKIIREIKDVHTPLGIHTHNDCSMAVANAIAAVEAGAVHVQGTINGCGERCGNPDLIAIIPSLQLKMGYRLIDPKKLRLLTEVSRFVGEVGNMVLQDNQPFVGRSAFAHKGGVHINAVLKNPRTYEHIEPDLVGNNRRFLTSELSGQTNILLKARAMKLHLEKNSPETKSILKTLQRLEHEGYQFEAAEASFELLIHRVLKTHKSFFELLDFRVIVTPSAKGKLLSEATLRLKVDSREEHTVATGDGPVNALDNALRKALAPFYPSLSKMHLSDYKVRVLEQKRGTAAKVRVFIESQDETGTWTTVGISENIIEASWKALVDSVEYKLLNEELGRKRT